MAERAAGRMQARQTYRTMSRMQRRRSFIQSKAGVSALLHVQTFSERRWGEVR
jgi:hypothetical protein